MSFSTLGLSPQLLKAINEQGYENATPIQAEAIPSVLSGQDLMAGAQTGTGKTAAFMLPLLQNLQARTPGHRGRVRALVLTPTRELASQVADSARRYGRHLPLRSTVVYGGVGVGPQISALRKGVEILIATPGRLMDHMARGTVDLSSVEMLVLDEADRMLDMGFLPAVERILGKLPNQRQTLLFSATFSGSIQKLARQLLQNPTHIEPEQPNSAAEGVDQSAYWVDHNRKRALLAYLIGSQNWRQVLVFTRTKRGADRLAKQLATDGIEAAAIHGDKTQAARSRALKAFKKQSVRALVATDVAARGLDIDQLPHVVNYDLPQNPEDYVHRIGRTGRAGRSGAAISLVSGEEKGQFVAIQRLLDARIHASVHTGFEPDPSRASRAPRNDSRKRQRPEHNRKRSANAAKRAPDAKRGRRDATRTAYTR